MIADLRPYAEYKESGLPWLGKLPAHWDVRRMKSAVANVIEPTSEIGPDDVYVALEHVESWTGHARPQKGAGLFAGQVKRFRHGDVLFGKLRPYLAKVTRLERAGACAGEFFVLRPTDPQVGAPYLEQQLRAKHTIGIINGSTFGAKMPRADWQFCGNLPIVLPPPAEQAAIVRFLDGANGRLERAIRAKRKVIALLGEQKQAIIHRAVTRGLDTSVPLKPSGIPWLGDIPQHWKVKRLKSICHFVTSGSRGWARYYSDTGDVFLRIGNISTTSVDLRLKRLTYVNPPAGAEGERTRAKPNDVLLSITAQIGAVGIVPPGFGEAFVNQHTALIRIKPYAAEPRWVAYLLLSEFGKDQCRLLTNGGTKIGLTLDDVRSLAVLLPPIKEQSDILAAIEGETYDVNLSISRLEREIELLREYRTRLVADVVTGKLDVRAVAAQLPDEAAPEAPADDADPMDGIEADDEEAIA